MSKFVYLHILHKTAKTCTDRNGRGLYHWIKGTHGPLIETYNFVLFVYNSHQSDSSKFRLQSHNFGILMFSWRGPNSLQFNFNVQSLKVVSLCSFRPIKVSFWIQLLTVWVKSHSHLPIWAVWLRSVHSVILANKMKFFITNTNKTNRHPETIFKNLCLQNLRA